MSERAIEVADLESALEKGEFLYYFQPKVDMLSGLVCGAEALMRWRRPAGKILLPQEFIPLAEESGFIRCLTRAMLPRLFAAIASIHERSKDLTISFNASVQNVADPEFLDDLEGWLRKGLIRPGRIELELTETAVNDVPGLAEQLAQVAALEVAITMDDFGRGYASVDALGRLPFSVIKLDQRMIGRLGESPKDMAIVQTAISLAHQLDLKIVAEGIETAETFQTLQFAGCSVGQGFWISRPLPLRDFLAFLDRQRRWAVMPVGQIHMVQLDHIRWRKAIIDSVLSHLHLRKGASASLQRSPELNPIRCQFGQWYYGPGRRFAGVRWYDALEQPHLRMHKLAKAILEAVRGEQPEPRVMEMIDELTRLSAVTLHRLQLLENHLVSRVSRRTTTAVRAISDEDIEAAAAGR